MAAVGAEEVAPVLGGGFDALVVGSKKPAPKRSSKLLKEK
jgi:hypothetical protein